jgi:hypothetical protein
MLQKLHTFIVAFTCGAILFFAASGVYDAVMRHIPAAPPVVVAETPAPVWSKPPATPVRDFETLTFITGPVAADIGELVVFRLSDPSKRADWCVIRQSDVGPSPTWYIDSSGSSIAFASNVSAQYTIVAAIVEDGFPKNPKILKHIFEYGIFQNTPRPDPSPNPGPDPEPEPEPEPETLAGWVRQNIPEAGRAQSAVLATCYDAVADAIERGTIRSQAAAYSSLRMNTQAKIRPGIWETFLGQLSEKVQTKLAGSTDVRLLGTIFREIAEGLKAPVMDVSTGFVCPDPTGQACQVPIIYRR